MAAGPTVFDGRLAANPALGRSLELLRTGAALTRTASPAGPQAGQGPADPFYA